jgi:hypothetical protein
MRGRTYNRYDDQPIIIPYILVCNFSCHYSQCDSNQWEDGEDDENGKQLGRLVSSQLLFAQGGHGRPWQKLGRSAVCNDRNEENRKSSQSTERLARMQQEQQMLHAVASGIWWLLT